ncbi:MAG: putative coiled-coil protein SlyX [Alphaproteobacteria bacterium]|jgi:uncharacterized coiled-coil protein SlyX
MNFSSNKVFKVVVVISAVWLLGGCELLEKVKKGKQYKPHSAPITTSDTGLCATQAHQESFGDFCYIPHWVDYILAVQQMDWSSKVELIRDLGEEPTATQLVQKILLSQGVDTPYQHRLRAQNWIIKLNTDAPELMSNLVNDLIYDNSKQLLEFESAITILSRVNVRQEKTITELQLSLSERELQIQKQQGQVEQLLKIETDLIEQNRNEKR